MLNKKAQWGVFSVILILLIVIFFVIIFFVYLKKSGYFSKPENSENVTSIITFLLACQSRDGKNLDANYSFEFNNQVVSQGNLFKDYFLPVQSKDSEVYHLHCWNNDYYDTQSIVQITNASDYKCPLENSSENTSYYCKRITARPVKIGKLSVSHSGNLAEEVNDVNLMISSDTDYKKIKMCNSWTSSIIYAFPKENLVKCSRFVNYSEFDPITNKYVYYPENITRCLDTNRTSYCEEIVDNTCIRYSRINPPKRLNGIVDRCYDLKNSLNNNTITITLEIKVKKEELNYGDEVNFWFFDEEKRRISGNWTFTTEDEFGNNVGAEDTFYTIKAIT